MGTVSYQWQGPVGGSLADAGHWVPAGVPGSGDSAVFGQANTSANASATGTATIGELLVHDDAVTLSNANVIADGLSDTRYNDTVGTAIDDGGSLTLGASAGLDTTTLYVGTFVSGALTVTAGSTLKDTEAYIGSSDHLDDYSNQGSLVTIEGSGAEWTTGSLEDGAGDLVVAAGGTVSVAGELNVIQPGDLVSLSHGTLHVGALRLSGTLELDAASNLTGTIELGGLVEAGGTQTVTLAAPITLLGPTPLGYDTLSGNGLELTVTGSIADAGTPASLGIEGFVRLSHAGNSYSGGTLLDGGANLRVAALGAAGTGAISFGTGSAILAVAPGVTLANTIDGFQAGDQIVLAGRAATAATWTNGVLTVENGSTAVASLHLVGDYATQAFAVAGNGKGDSVVIVGPPVFSHSFTLTTGIDTVSGSSGNDLVIAAAGTLGTGDVINGGGGYNALQLQGGGVFHLYAPETLENIGAIYATEGGTAADQQTLYLRSGQDAQVVVSASSTDNPGQPWRNSITIHGADDADTLHLGPGYDTVVLGSAAETVIGGSGAVAISADAGMLGATLSGGSGGGTLFVTGSAETSVMGAGITRIQTVILPSDPANGYGTIGDFTANGEAGLTIEATGPAGTIRAGGADQTIVAAHTRNTDEPHQVGGFLTMVGSTAGHDTFKGTFESFITDTIDNFSAPGDVIDVTDMAPAALSVTYSYNELQLIIASGPNAGANAPIYLPDFDFNPAGFDVTDDGHGGTQITYFSPVDAAAQKLTSAMAGFGAGGNALQTSAASSAAQHQPPLLAAAPTTHG
jgi:hypothetical protein